MFILTKNSSRSFLGNLEELGGITLEDNRISFNSGAIARVMNGGEAEEVQARVDDIVAALNYGKVAVYDVSKAVGYWKPKSSTHKKAEPKASPPAGK